MKLVRFGDLGKERTGIMDASGLRRDLCSIGIKDFDGTFFQSGGLDSLKELSTNDIEALPMVEDGIRWGACIPRPGKIICVGLNYIDHAKESGMEIPQEPILFQKAANTVVGPFDPVIIPPNSQKTDWEIEIGIVIGKDASYLKAPSFSIGHIAGYCISHDVSERAFQLERGGQWTKGKSCDNFNPTGPFLVTPDELDAHHIPLMLKVNDVVIQEGNTSNMIFDMEYLVWYISQFMTLEAGDLISTGTPAGVGLGMNPQRFLKEGDIVELWAEGLGYQRQHCENWQRK